MRRALLTLLLAAAAVAARAQDEYGAKGLFPVYETAGQWVVFDKTAQKGGSQALAPGSTFLVIGSKGADLFVVARSSPTYGGACRGRKPARLRAALLKGPRSSVGDPVLAVKVPNGFALKGSRAVYRALPNAVDESFYKALDAALKADAADAIALKIDYAARPRIAGLKNPAVLVTGAQFASSYRRCLRLADGEKLVGGCVEMPHDLMGETARLNFVIYDPSGKGAPFLLAYTKDEPLWGHERWGFVLRSTGARLFLRDAMDPRCRAGF